MKNEKVILVDENDTAIGEMEKMEAHRKGALHRAFSVFIFNGSGQMLLQQRALDKYHSAGLWTNACCSHPRPGEGTLAAARRRLLEEMGMNAELEHKTSFIYKTDPASAGFESGLTEHEYDHIFTGRTNQDPKINPEEVNAYEWLSIDEIKERIKISPHQFTHWFKIAIRNFF